MRYLISHNSDPFFTNWFSPENFMEGMTVYDVHNETFTTDGKTWHPIKRDIL